MDTDWTLLKVTKPSPSECEAGLSAATTCPPTSSTLLGTGNENDHDDDNDNDAILSMGERRAPPGEERAGLTHELQIPEQRPNTAGGSPADDEDSPSRNMIQGARTLATTMVILRREEEE